jgi:hypothetical protein
LEEKLIFMFIVGNVWPFLLLGIRDGLGVEVLDGRVGVVRIAEEWVDPDDLVPGVWTNWSNDPVGDGLVVVRPRLA